jgi:hypothetical protein
MAATAVTPYRLTQQLEHVLGAGFSEVGPRSQWHPREGIEDHGQLGPSPSASNSHCTHTEEVIEVWEKDPSVQAFTDLMNRTIDKPIEQMAVDATGSSV